MCAFDNINVRTRWRGKRLFFLLRFEHVQIEPLRFFFGQTRVIVLVDVVLVGRCLSLL